MENKLNTLINQTVVTCSAGGAAGSTLVLTFENQSYVFVWCSWRIEQGDDVIVTSSDTISPNGRITKKTPILVGRKLMRCQLTLQYDVEMVFDNEYKFRIFCDIGHSRDDYDTNWELTIPSEKISIEISNHFKQHII